MRTINRKFGLSILFIVIAFTANAQKLPNVQQISLRAPANIKIDGKLTEWGDKFQAYNKSTEVFYTLSNDDNKLYLTLQATNAQTITKIVLGGIAFTINPSGKKNDKNGVVITFPEYDAKNQPVYIILNNKPAPTSDTEKNKMQADSFLNAHNEQLRDKLKLIQVLGVKAIADSIVSIYNEYGIKAISLFDNKINYIYELAIPLKYLQITMDKPLKFSYNIKLNGSNKGNVQIVESSRGNLLVYKGGDGVDYSIGPATPQNMIMAYPTDFWGEYTLAKK